MDDDILSVVKVTVVKDKKWRSIMNIVHWAGKRISCSFFLKVEKSNKIRYNNSVMRV
jgi:hypothetical protein